MTDNPNQLSFNKQALLKIRELKQRLDQAQVGTGEPIAIVSMACRFPRRSRTPEEFWKCLVEQTDEVSEIPADRWDLEAFYDDDPEIPGKMYARRGVFLDDLDLMDPEFFRISPREATWVDPQQRLLLEVGWEALERAGWPPERIGEHTGIFVGWMHNDYQNEASDSFLNLNPYIATGAAGSFLCGRLAYHLGLQGPSVAVDTACSSSLVALHLAIQSLQQRDCDRALVGGVNAICSPTTNILTCKLKALSPHGHSRAFDAAADGYLRGEGCGVVTLRRLSEAQADHDPILGIIRGSAIGHNGFSSGLTAPNPKAQEKVIRQALQRAGISAAEVAYLEAHGTGTELGDPIEMQAAVAALSEHRPPHQPLLVGSVKTNIGHLEAAAGMAGLIKVLLSIEHNSIPAQLNFEQPNPHIPWDKIPVKVVTQASEWPNAKQRIAGVSAFGMSGTNAHVVIEAPENPVHRVFPPRAPNRVPSKSDASQQTLAPQPQLICLSGKSDEAVRSLAESYERRIASDPSLSPRDVAYTANVGRSHFENRAAVLATDRNSLLDGLRILGRAGTSDSVSTGSGRRPPKTAWQFTGQGSQFVGMARGLYDSQPIFRDAIDDCTRNLAAWCDGSLVDVLFQQEDRIHLTNWTQPAIFAVQMGLAKLLQSWGLQPDMVWGHSVGQYAAACVAGILSWEDGLRLIYERGRLIGELPQGGLMLAVFAPAEVAHEAVAASSGVSLAAMNGTHIVLSGPTAAIQDVEARFNERGIRSKRLKTSHAFHSSMMDSVLQPFEAIADQFTYDHARLPLICNLSGRALEPTTRLDGAYWARHIREAVRFADCIDTASELGCEVILEIGPRAVLTGMAAARWKRPKETLISCLEQDSDDRAAVLRAMGQLYVQGVTPRFEAMHAGQKGRIVALPTYPFQRRRFWGPDKPGALHAEHHTAHPLLGCQISLAGVQDEKRYENSLEPDSPSWLPDHEVMGSTVLPGAAYLEIAVAAADSCPIEEITFEQPLRVASRTTLQTIVRTSSQNPATIETYSSPAGSSSWTLNFAAKLAASQGPQPDPVDRATLEAACTETVAPGDFYRKMHELGLNYGPSFQTISQLRYSPDGVLSRLKTHEDVRGFTIPPTLLDGALHSLAVGLLQEDDGQLFLPVGIGRLHCYQGVHDEVWCHAKWKQNEGRTRTADLTLFTESGQVVLVIEELRVQQASGAALRQIQGTGSHGLIYRVDWQDFRLPAQETQSKQWLLIDSSPEPVAPTLARELIVRGHRVIELGLKSEGPFLQTTEKQFTLCGTSSGDWTSLFDRLSEGDTPFEPQGVIWRFAPGGGSEDTKANCDGLLNLLRVLQERGIRQIECGLQLVTTDAIAIDEQPQTNPNQTQYWGLGRVIGAEQPEYRCRLIDVSSAEKDLRATSTALLEILLTETRDNQFAIRDGKLHVPRMKRVARTAGSRSGSLVNPDGSYLITGGLGMLGRQAAKWLAENGAKQVVLVSRRPPDAAARAFLDTISEMGCDCIVHPADMGSREDVQQLFARFGQELRALSGVIHAAGILDDALLGEQTWRRFEEVLRPKAVGAALLHEFTESLELDFFVLYSSAASVLGSPGQSNYATANAFLDGLAWQRRSQGLPAISINWGPWTEGMADDERIVKRLALQGITPLTVADAHAALETLIAEDIAQATVMDADWRRMRFGPSSESPPILAELSPVKPSSRKGDSKLVRSLKQLTGTKRRELLLTTIRDSLQGILSTPEPPDVDRPLIEMGLDSLMAVEFGTELQQLVGEEFAVGPTMLFDHPTIQAITDHVLELLAGDSAAEPAVAPVAVAAPKESSEGTREDVAVIGMSCRFPGARNVSEFWSNLLNGIDSVSQIPEGRWDVDRFYSPEREPGKMLTREGGFLEDVGDFDAAFFNISDQEACWIDPQHRLLLENSYNALEDAGIPLAPLPDANVGVFMGIMGQDYAFLPTLDDADVIQAFRGAGLSHSAGVGRISYTFGFEGPSVAVDTASSSSLVAIVQAVRSLQEGSCNMALAGGVNAILAPVNSLLMSKAGLLSPDGRCKSFSADADGFGRGEGCGVVVLKRVSDARRDGDRIMAIIRGAAVVHNGFSGGITAPSGRAQSRVISDALRDARLAPAEVDYLEAHGTGTEYGDPMELGAAAAVFGKGRKRDRPLLVGSVKANISHLEAAGGVSGLIKTVLALQHGVIPPQIHFENPSPHIPWQRMPVRIVTETTPWPETEQRIAGVTALGLAGTNAHVLLSADTTGADSVEVANHVDESVPTSRRKTELLVLSARCRQSLTTLAASYRDFLEEHPRIDLADVCYTAATGRRHLEHRLAIPIESHQDANEKLESFIRSRSRTNSESLQRDPPESRKLQPHGIAVGSDAGNPKIAWLFTGDQNSHLSAANDLLEQEAVFRNVIMGFEERLTELLGRTSQAGFRLTECLQNPSRTTPPMAGICLFAVQSGLAGLWEAWGIEPDVVVGFGIGQYSAACKAGCLRTEDALRLLIHRTQLVKTLADNRIDERSGHPLNEAELHEHTRARLDEFEAFADRFNYYPPNLPLICSMSGQIVPVHRSLGGSYWRRHVVAQAMPEEAARTLAEMDCSEILTVGPVSPMNPDDRRCVAAMGQRLLHSLEPDQLARKSLLNAIGKLYAAGASPDFRGLHLGQQRKRISLPTYPFQKKRYWITELGDYADPSQLSLSET